jgi:hypothetical protein
MKHFGDRLNETLKDEARYILAHTPCIGSINLDAFRALSRAEQRSLWSTATTADREGLALQVIQRKHDGWTHDDILIYTQALNEKFS